MGTVCSSCESTSIATAKLITQDGKLQEFPYPVKVSYVLQKQPLCFICNSDDLEFDDYVKQMKKDEDLCPGQIYFALPLTSLRHPLHAEKMAELAVKASLALMKSSDRKYGASCLKGVNVNVDAIVSTERESGNRPVREVVTYGGGGGSGSAMAKKRYCTTGNGRGSNLVTKLTIIQE